MKGCTTRLKQPGALASDPGWLVRHDGAGSRRFLRWNGVDRLKVRLYPVLSLPMLPVSALSPRRSLSPSASLTKVEVDSLFDTSSSSEQAPRSTWT